MSTILMIILVLLLIGSLPTWPYSTGWGYYPSGGLGLVLVVALILLFLIGAQSDVIRREFPKRKPLHRVDAGVFLVSRDCRGASSDTPR